MTGATDIGAQRGLPGGGDGGCASDQTPGKSTPVDRFRRMSICLGITASVILSGCGGGGSDSDSPPPTSNDSPPPATNDDSSPDTQTVTPTANAGPDQSVSEATTVQLSGSGSGSGALSYQWTQTAGEPSLALSGAQTATARFQAPEVVDAQTFTFELTVTDANGAQERDSVVITVRPAGADPGESPTLSGTLSFEHIPVHGNCRGLDYSGAQLRPIRGATVQLIDAATGSVIDTTVSSEEGDYGFEVAAGRKVFVRTRAELKQGGSPGWDVEVRDNTSRTSLALADRPLYVLDSQTFVVEDGRELNLVADSGWNGSRYGSYRAAAPFAVLDTIYSGISLVLGADPGAFFPPLDVFWSVNNTTVRSNGLQIAQGEIGNSFYNPNIDSLFLLGKADDDTEEYDSHVIAHEWGHYFEDNFSRSDSIGGPHNLGQRLDMRLAFGEGWASALAGMILEDPLYCDTAGAGQAGGFGMNMDRDRFGVAGWFNEVSVAAIMYDLWDTQLIDDDSAGIGFAPMYDALVGEQATTPALTSIFSFAAALKARIPDQTLVVDSILQNNGVTGSDAYGTGESNDSENGAGVDVLPVYTNISPTGETVRICSNGQYDSNHSGNKLSVFRYLRLPVNLSVPYRITVQNVNPPTSPSSSEISCEGSMHSDPDFLLFREGRVVERGARCRANVEDATTGPLPPGDYVLAVSEYRFADGDPSSFAPEQSCFDVNVRPVQ